MKLYITLTKRNLAVIFLSVVITLFVVSQIASSTAYKIDGSTHALRENYIRSLGHRIDEKQISSKEIIVPESFGRVYNQYNDLQKKAGFDLSDYKGRRATVYTYRMLNQPDTQIHLMVCDGVIIGGDIASVKLGGEMKPLKNSK